MNTATAIANTNNYNNLHIFTNDCLRLSDNPSLLNALDTSETLHAVYFIRYTKQNNKNNPPIHRLKFLLDSLRCLQKQLEEFGIPLYTINAPMMKTVQDLILRWGITRVTMEKPTSYVGKRDSVAMKNILEAHGVRLETALSNTLYDITRIQSNIKYKQFIHITDKMEPQFPVSGGKIELLVKFRLPCDLEVNTKLPEIRELGVTDEMLSKLDSKYKGGELEAMEQLNKRIKREEGIISDTTALSPALNFGCISPRIIHEYIHKHSVDPEVAGKIYTGLRKRDYLILIGGQCSNINNQACIYNYILPWDDNKEHLRRFEAGQTGFPIVDAIITQIKREGYTQTRHRAILAKFLTCGMLWLGWHHGVKLFYEWSLDYNPSICGLSWMHSACATWLQEETELGDTNPIDEARALDPEGKYIRHYLPQLVDFPPEFVHTPWRAPLNIQMDMGCEIGDKYSQPLYPEPEKRFLHCKNRLRVFYTLIMNVHSRRPIESLGKRKMECTTEPNNEKLQHTL